MWDIQAQGSYLREVFEIEVVHCGKEKELHVLVVDLQDVRAGLSVNAELQLPLLPVAPSADVLSSPHTLAAPCETPAFLSAAAASAIPAVGGTRKRPRERPKQTERHTERDTLTL